MRTRRATQTNRVVGFPPALHDDADDNTPGRTGGLGHSDNFGLTHPTNLLLSDSVYKKRVETKSRVEKSEVE